MTGNKSYLLDYEEIHGGSVAFRGDPKGGRITGKGKISTGKLDFEDVYFVKELKFNLFSVSQICDKKNSVLFTDTECVVLSPDFKLVDENYVLLRVPRKDNMHSIDLKNIVPLVDDYSRFSWVFFLATKDETSEILKTFITGIENLIDLKVKVIRCDNGTEFKNKVMNQFCEMKGIKREFSVARTPQQNGVAERKNRTLIEAARTMLADSKLPTTFWAEAVNTACYVQNRVLVIKPHNKTPYELFLGRKPALSFMRPFGCPVTILNTLYHLGKFDGKANEGFFVGYSTNSKAYMVFNNRTRIVEENLHVKFSEETPNIAGNGPNWLFDIDALTISMNYKPVVAGNQTNGNAGTKENIDAGQDGKKIVPDQKYILLPLLTSDPSLSKSSKDSPDAGFKPSGEEEKIDSEHQENEDSEVPNTEEPRVNQEQDANVNNTNNINTVSPTVSAADIENNVVDENIVYGCIDDPNMPNLEEIVYSDDDEEVGAEADMNNLATNVPVSPIPRFGYTCPSPQTRRMTKSLTEHAMLSSVQQRTNHKDFHNCLFACFLSQAEPKKVWTLVDLPHGKRAIGTKWVYTNKKDERGIVIRNKARLKRRSDYSPPPGFEDPDFPDRVYKVEKALYGLHQDPRAWDQGLQVKQKNDGIFTSQDKYVTEILKKFGFSDVKTANTPMETYKPLLKDTDGEDVHEHMYRSMIGSLMYLTSSRLDIMFAVCQPKLGLWYPKDSPFDLVAHSNSDYAGASLDRKSITRELECLTSKALIEGRLIVLICSGLYTKDDWNGVQQLLRIELGAARLTYYCYVTVGVTTAEENANFAEIVDFLNANPIRYALTVSPTIYVSCIKQFWSTAKTKTVNNETQIHAKVEGKTIVISESSVRRDLQFNDEDVDETVTKEREDIMERAATTASSLEAEQDSGNINRTQSMATLNEPSPQGTSSGSGLRCQDTILGGAEVQTRFETASKQSNEPSLLRANTLGSGEDRLKLNKLMELCTKLFARVLDLETTKTAQAKEIANLKKRVNKLERKKKSRTPGMNLFKISTSRRRSLGEEDASKQGRNLKQRAIIEDSDFDEEFDANMDKAFKQVY
ncbi:putative ribonuclease H-like domain-containing protein [Tanacetum coccineum]|uniref:Ribonuclease H-like domain-containing protein n=1 Tax=Tanacetum coccineum TaxID=301880 RepID=A0ABQ5FDB7_9ASTR